MNAIRELLAQGPLKPPRRDNPVISAEFECGCVGFAEPGAEGRWLVVDDQHVYKRRDME